MTCSCPREGSPYSSPNPTHSTLLALRFRDLRVRSNRQNLLQAWLGSKLFRASGLGALQVEKGAGGMQHGRGFSANCDGRDRKGAGGAALGGEVTGKSAPSSTGQAAHSRALVLHIIRDGRALAMSLEKLRHVRPFPWVDRPKA
jgi:hypothetical protein